MSERTYTISNDLRHELMDYFDQRADADQPSGSHPIANDEMRLYEELNRLNANIGDAQKGFWAGFEIAHMNPNDGEIRKHWIEWSELQKRNATPAEQSNVPQLSCASLITGVEPAKPDGDAGEG